MAPERVKTPHGISTEAVTSHCRNLVAHYIDEIENTNSLEQDQAPSTLGVWSSSKLFVVRLVNKVLLKKKYIVQMFTFIVFPLKEMLRSAEYMDDVVRHSKLKTIILNHFDTQYFKIDEKSKALISKH